MYLMFVVNRVRGVLLHVVTGSAKLVLVPASATPDGLVSSVHSAVVKSGNFVTHLFDLHY